MDPNSNIGIVTRLAASRHPAPVSLQLAVSYQGGEREYVHIRNWPFSIGRNPSSDLCLNSSDFVSRRHARLMKADEAVKLVASGRNPTFLNGALVPPDIPIDVTPGDRIELPNYLIEILAPSREATEDRAMSVETISGGAAIIRRIASSLNTSQWTAQAVVDWLDEKSGREIRICQDPATLFLATGISLEGLKSRLALFEQLSEPLDPYTLNIEITNPGAEVIIVE